MEYRELLENEIDMVWNIDRSEYVDAIYVYQSGNLTEEIIGQDFSGWNQRDVLIYSPILKDCFRFLHIDRKYRKTGIGGFLLKKAAEKARLLGAKRMYVSSCESKNTVDFYFHMGFQPAMEIDDELFKLEPQDIHMEMTL